MMDHGGKVSTLGRLNHAVGLIAALCTIFLSVLKQNNKGSGTTLWGLCNARYISNESHKA